MFAVVECLYERSREVSVVPLSWIVNDESNASQLLCYWPSENVKPRIIKRWHLPSRSWLTFSLRFLRTDGKTTPCLGEGGASWWRGQVGGHRITAQPLLI